MFDNATNPAPATAPGFCLDSVALSGLRRFSDDTESLARSWSLAPVTPMDWVIDPAPIANEGAEGGFFVTSGHIRGYAKPRKRHAADPMSRPLAAYEKIVSDLAFLLRLPVPPVTLFLRATAPGLEARHHAVSAVPFAGHTSWRKTLEQPGMAAHVRQFTAPVMSAMAAFDTWVHAHDHCNNPENLLVSPAGEAPAFAFIDYGQSLLEKWRAGGYKTEFAAPLYDGGTKMDFCALRAAVAAIETIPDASIRAIVERIPPEFLAPAHAQVIIEGLLYRRDHLRAALAGTCGGLLLDGNTRRLLESRRPATKDSFRVTI